jgi:ATP-dependent Clp protease adaptor protein ClpS
MSDALNEPNITTSKKAKTRGKRRTRRIPPFNVILENDDFHSFEFVVEVLTKTFGYNLERSYQLMMQAHNSDRAIVWTGPKEVAELKVEQILTFHETRSDGRNLGPLGCSIEPAAG